MNNEKLSLPLLASLYIGNKRHSPDFILSVSKKLTNFDGNNSSPNEFICIIVFHIPVLFLSFKL